MMVFWHLFKTDGKEVNWAEQIAMERPNICISHKFKEFQKGTRRTDLKPHLRRD